MNSGEFINIYEDPASGTSLEGQAKLIQPSDIGNEGLNPGYEYWQVEFLDQPGEYFDRIIKTRHQGPLSPERVQPGREKRRQDNILTLADFTEVKIYKIAFQSERNTNIYNGLGDMEEPAGFSVVESFEAENDDEANAYAEEIYPDQEWYVLDSDWDNING